MTHTSPVIGIILDYEEAGSYAATPWYALRENYCRAVQEAGGVPLLIPHCTDAVGRYLDIIDGMLIAGGAFDISPALYGDATVHDTVTLKTGRTDFETAMTKGALEKKQPILGICGGEQLLNVILGGTLIQHIPDAIPNALPHEVKDRTRPAHEVKVTANTLLHRIVQQDVIGVNTTHHQAVAKTGPNVVVNGVAPDGVIEGIEYTEHPFCLGVQWHPEYGVSGADRAIFTVFVSAAR